MENKIIKFGADWCGPCKAMKPQMEKFKKLIQESNIEVLDLDIDAEENVELAQQYGVRSIPYTVFIKNDKLEKHMVGMKTSDELYEVFQEIYQN